ncbi:MAG: T9SS type A sorting domain-containing protein [Bacteroidetes bacterium]|nr:T9SS type A sorting domain-containing protein [Bacteroidota bacterium]
MMACRHANGYDWWLLKQGFDTNIVYTFLVTKDTVELSHVQSFAEPHFGVADIFGQACFSTNGSKYAFATGGVNLGAQLYIADFDRCTGLLSNPKTINVPIDSTNYPFFDNQGKRDSTILGVCFSPNDNFLYINKYFNTYQYEYNNPDSVQAWYLVHRYDTLAEYSLFGQLQKGIDGRIYMGKHSGYQPFNNVINKPNIKGAGCDFCQFCLDFSAFNGASTSPPNMPDFNLGPLQPCWPLENSQLAVGSKQLEVYPNPASTIFYIKNAERKKKELYSVLGELLFSTKADEINMTFLAKGMYYLRVENEVVKVVVE